MPKLRHLMLFATALPGAAGAQSFQSLDAIDAALRGAGAVAVPVDRRLRLAACPEPLAVAPPALGAVAVACRALGWRLRVPVSAVISATGAPAGAIVIKRGDPVSASIESDGFTVSASGTAETDGRIGERIRVRIDKAGPPVLGQILDAGLVRIPALN